jgi:hypothetical protein
MHAFEEEVIAEPIVLTPMKSLEGDKDHVYIEDLETVPKIVNLALLQLPFMLTAYYLFYFFDADPEEGMERTSKIAHRGSIMISVVLCLAMGLLSYDDDLLLFY